MENLMMFINRVVFEKTQIRGYGVVINTINGLKLFDFYTLELPWLGNEKKVSCIPTGEYEVMKRQSPSNGNCFELLSVPERDNIQIHAGNFYTDILGCVLVGSSFGDVNKDGYLDVVNSRATLKSLVEMMPQHFKLIIS